MGKILYETHPGFRESLGHCEEVLRSELDRPLASILWPDGLGASVSGEGAAAALTAFQYALVQLWKSWGIEPSAVMGADEGKVAAACAAGVLEWDDGLKLSAQKSRAADHIPAKSSHLSVAGSIEELSANGFHSYLEIGPGGMFGTTPCLPSLMRERNDWEALASSLGALFVSGAQVDWKGFDAVYHRQRIPLPTYPFSRKRYWLEPSEVRSLVGPFSAVES
jgi:acyl transferase domain-containing protein